MADNRNRKRPIQVKFFVDEKDQALIKKKMEIAGIENMSAYLRKMAIDGYIVKLEMNSEGQKVTVNGRTEKLETVGVKGTFRYSENKLRVKTWSRKKGGLLYEIHIWNYYSILSFIVQQSHQKRNQRRFVVQMYYFSNRNS